MFHLFALRLSEGRMRYDMARAPSMVKAWREFGLLWWQYMTETARDVCIVGFDEIRDRIYEKLQELEFKANLPPGVFPTQIDIDPGDCSQAHAEREATRLNQEILQWMGDDVFAFAVAGLSPNADPNETVFPSYDPRKFECHLAFDRGGTKMIKQPFMAIPMSVAASGQQVREGVVAEEIVDDRVLTMTAWHLVNNTDAMIFSLPDNRGSNLYRALHDEPQTEAGGLPAALIQRHPRLGQTFEDGVHQVVFCTTAQSWEQFEAAERWYEKHGTFLGA